MADQFCLRWNNFQTNIVSALESLKCSEDLVDVTLTCEGRNIRAHKVILSACSPYFRTVFKENPCQHPVIILKDVLAEDIVSLLSYMYQGEVFIEESKLTSFLHTAALLQVKGLTGVPPQNRENFIASNIPITTNKLYTQLTISSKPSPHNSKNDPKPSVAPKKRRSSTSDKPNYVSFEAYKKSKMTNQNDAANAMENNMEKSKKPENNINESKENKVDIVANTNGNTAKSQSQQSVKDGSLVTVKKEVDEDEESPNEDQSAEKENESLPDYENSMLARSLLSGINPSKSDINANNSSPKSKMPQMIDAPNITRRDLNPFSNAKKSPPKVIPIADEQIKSERQSPKIETDFEPEVLISEQNDGTGADYSELGISIVPGLPGTSHSLAHQQSNHAAICGDCPHCGMKYSNQSALKYHVRLMHSDLTNRLCCYLCPRSFTMRETFKEHMWTTHGQRN